MDSGLLTGERVTPVTIITGFLGSGKTTLLRDMLSSASLSDAIVLVNEFGEVGIDHLLVEEIAENTVLLDSGCICCALREDIITSLRDLYFRRMTGELPAFGRVIIETSGLADPISILHTLLTDPELLERYRHMQTITVFDACLGPQQLDEYEETRRQLSVADVIVISKDDLASLSDVETAGNRAREFNPAARIVPRRHVEDPAELALSSNVEGVAAEIPAYDCPPVHTSGLGSVALRRTTPLDWSRLNSWFLMLTRDGEGTVLRMKGVVDVAGSARPIVIQAVQNVFYPAEELDEWPEQQRVSKIVLIGRNLDRDRIVMKFDSHLSGSAGDGKLSQ